MTGTGKYQLTKPGDREITLTRTFDAPRRLVFDAFTKPEMVKRWLYGPADWPLVVCEIDLRVGGKLRYVWRHKEREVTWASPASSARSWCDVFHTYSSYARGGDLLLGAYNFLDLTPKGRNEKEIMKAMLQMKKMDIAALQRAHAG